MQLPYSIIFLLKVSSKGGKESLRESFEEVTYRILHIGKSYTMLSGTSFEGNDNFKNSSIVFH